MAIAIKNVVNWTATYGPTTSGSLGSASIGDLVVVLANTVTGGSVPTDNASNTYSLVSGRTDGTFGGGMWYSFLTTGNAGLTVTLNSGSGGQECTGIAWLISGASAYNSDQANNANFSGSNTAWTVGPTTSAPPANSIAMFVLATNNVDQTGTADPSGYNTTGSNGFTTGMNTAAHVYASGAPCITGYKITSATETPSTTLAVGANWYGVVASFSPTGGGGFTAKFRKTFSHLGTRVGARQVQF
jgi:hypothetical protein